MTVSLLPPDPTQREEAAGYLRSLSGLLLLFATAHLILLVFMASGLKHIDVWLALVIPQVALAALAYGNARARYRFVSPDVQLLALIVVAAFVITAYLHLNGSFSGTQTGAYVLLLLISTVYFTPLAGAISTVMSVGMFGALLYLEHEGILTPAPLTPERYKLPRIPGFAQSVFQVVLFINAAGYVMALYIARALRRRKNELQAANDRLSELDETKNRFLSVVSHDLRTPITSIKAYAEILDDEAEDISADDQHKYARIIAGEADRLHRLVTDLLDLDKMEAGKMDWTMHVQDIRPALENTFHVFAGAAQDKNITLATDIADELPAVHVDADRIAQLVANLLSNAIKFTPAGGQVTLAGTSTQNSEVSVSVSDTGPGIAEEDLPRLFDRFSQTATGKKDGGGTGLGLAIAHEIAAAHGGTLSVASTPGQGTTFTFTLARAHKDEPGR